jgi:hypothetical protein
LEKKDIGGIIEGENNKSEILERWIIRRERDNGGRGNIRKNRRAIVKVGVIEVGVM